ncbi:MAG: glycosyl hydrolase family 8, partial [Actinomycetota bacterium]
GAATAAPAPNDGGAPVYGYEAGRVLVRMAEDCSSRGRAIAAKPWPFLSAQARSGQIAAQYGLDGKVQASYTSPLADVAAAASATATGNRGQAAALLDKAEAQDRAQPTYYGAAWLALGRIMLTTSWLGGCS